jgi:hypothetical protein
LLGEIERRGEGRAGLGEELTGEDKPGEQADCQEMLGR